MLRRVSVVGGDWQVSAKELMQTSFVTMLDGTVVDAHVQCGKSFGNGGSKASTARVGGNVFRNTYALSWADGAKLLQFARWEAWSTLNEMSDQIKGHMTVAQESHASALLEEITTVAPRMTKPVAIMRPMPRAPPVTSTTFSLTSKRSIFSTNTRLVIVFSTSWVS